MSSTNRVALMCAMAALIAMNARIVWAASDESFLVPAELWDRPRTGLTIMGVVAVRQAIQALLNKPEARLTLRHPPGPESGAQAEELRAWLVAHAVEPARIVLRADLPARQPLQLEVGR